MSARCSYREGRQQCPYEGIGTPILCAAHRLALETVAGQQDPIEALLGNATTALTREFEKFLQRGRDAVRQALPQESPAGRPRRHAAPPPRQRPAAPPPAPPNEDPRVVMGFRPDEALTKTSIKARQRALADLFHPDKGGSVESMQRVNEAAQKLLKDLKC